MANFQYSALDSKGEQTTGTISAGTEADAIQQLRAQGLYPTQIMEEGKQIYLDMVEAMPLGPDSPQAQQGVARWHQHLRYFYEPDTHILLGLGDLYNDDPQFNAFFQRIHPDLAAFMRQAIQVYCRDK